MPLCKGNSLETKVKGSPTIHSGMMHCGVGVEPDLSSRVVWLDSQ